MDKIIMPEMYDPNMTAYIRDMEIVVDTTSGIGDTDDSAWTMGNKGAMKETTDSDHGSNLHKLTGITSGARIDIAPNSAKIREQYLHNFIKMFIKMIELFSAFSVRELRVVTRTIV
jgi:hypothetical protein